MKLPRKLTVIAALHSLTDDVETLSLLYEDLYDRIRMLETVLAETRARMKQPPKAETKNAA